MKTFFERISAWLLSMFLIGCIIFIFIILEISHEWSGGIIELVIKIIAIIISFLIFILFWLWLIYQSRNEKIKFLKILSGFVILIVLLIASTRVIKHSINKQDEEKPRETTAVSTELPKDIVKVGEIVYKEKSGLMNEPSYYFSVEVENVSDKYRIDNITINLTAYKDNVAFYKEKAELQLLWNKDSSGGLNPKGKTTLYFFIKNVSPKTFPPKPWTYSTNVELVVGRQF
jgi:hypothetical protein